MNYSCNKIREGKKKIKWKNEKKFILVEMLGKVEWVKEILLVIGLLLGIYFVFFVYSGIIIVLLVVSGI